MPKNIGIIGIGMLGKAVAQHLLSCGYKVTIYNRSKNKTITLEENGAKVVESPKKVAESSDLVFTILTNADAVKQVSFEENGIIHGKKNDLVVADISTIDPIASVEIAKKFEEFDITMLDTPVMGGPNVAIDGKLVLMASGNKEKFEAFRDVFETVASKIFYLGKNGTAHTVKLAMNLQIAMLALALSEGITLIKSASIEPEVFLRILNSTYFKTGMSEKKAYKMIKNSFKPTFTLRNLKKDLDTISQTTKSYGLNLPLTTMANKIYENAVETGFGELDYTGILAFLEKTTKSDK